MQIRTCADSLLQPGVCCEPDCSDAATMAVLDQDLTEHTFCPKHASSPLVFGRKPLVFDPLWGPTCP